MRIRESRSLLKRYIMTYAAFSPVGPRIAMAESDDLFHWKRLGLATYAHWHGIELGNVDDKDASLFPVAIPNSTGQLATGRSIVRFFQVRSRGDRAPSWKARGRYLRPGEHLDSYCPADLTSRDADRLGQFTSHHRLATPVSPWERLKIGAGPHPS